MREDAKSRRGTLPPKLLLETLATFHKILFPITTIGERRSMRMLKALIRRDGFDKNGRTVHFPREPPWDMTYEYWGDRLQTLYDIAQKRPPRSAIIAWFERHTTDRNVLIIAILGLFLAAFFGFLSFIVGSL